MGFHRRLNTQHGFSLTEVLIAMALMTVVSAGAMTLVVLSMDFQSQSWSQQRYKDEAYTAAEHICRAVREAVLVSISGEQSQTLDIHRRGGRKARFTVEQPPNSAGHLFFYPDVENHPRRRVLIARGLSRVQQLPYFSRNQNVIYVNLRVGEAEHVAQTDRSAQKTVEGIDVRTVAVLRKGS